MSTRTYDDVVDVVLLWWRDGDGDLVDALVDALTPLADGGYIWLLTPKAGRDGHVEPSEIGEAAPTAGLSQTSSVSAGTGLVGHAGWSRRRRGAERPGPLRPSAAPDVGTGRVPGVSRAGGRLDWRLALAGSGLDGSPDTLHRDGKDQQWRSRSASRPLISS